jgi:inorganic pyrophosphatase
MANRHLVIRLADLETLDPETGDYNAIVETPKGHRNKYKYEERLDGFVLHGVLAPGAVFPFDFGFLPGTVGGDGDPLDILVLLDEPVYPGCVVPVRLIGVIEAEQSGPGEPAQRNDRLVGVSVKSHEYRHVEDLTDLPRSLVDEISYFFESYNRIKGKEFKPLARRGATAAVKLVERGMKHYLKAEEP